MKDLATYGVRTVFLAIVIIISLIHSRGFCAPPFMDFEGVGGGGIVPGAYLVNPPEEGKLVGEPAISHWSLIGGGNNVYTFGLTLSLAERFELGYVLEVNDFHRLRHDIKRDSKGALDVKEPWIYMSNIHFKTLFIRESKYIPAFAITCEFKINHTIQTMNDNIDKGLDPVGYDDDMGVDFDFSFSKTLKDFFYFPCIINANLRLTRGYYLGLLGFGSNYTANGELSLAFLIHPKVALGVEARQQNHEMKALPLKGYSMEEDTFWDTFVTFFPNRKFSIAVAFCKFGNIVNKDVNFFVCNLKYDF